MTNLVNSSEIEQIVGINRHERRHYARAKSAERTVYILHSRHCLESGRDLRDCPYSLALDNGILAEMWADLEDRPVIVAITTVNQIDRLTPVPA